MVATNAEYMEVPYSAYYSTGVRPGQHERRLNTFTCDASERYWAFVGITNSQTRRFSLEHASNYSSKFHATDAYGGLETDVA